MNAAVNLLKGVAILLVLWQHTVPPKVTDALWGNVWVRPAVPVFLVLLGLNLAMSLQRRGGVRFEAAWLRPYLLRRLDRIAVPFLLVLAVGYVIAFAEGTFRLQSALVVGGLPIDAPGNYFIPALVGAVLLFPALHWCYERRPGGTVVAVIAVNLAFELIAVGVLGRSAVAGSLIYAGNPLRWLALIALGVWIARDPRMGARRNLWLVALAVPSLGYLLLDHLAPERLSLFLDGYTRVTNLFAAPWAVLLVLLGLRVLPAREPRAPGARLLAEFGRASFHIFLVQMLVTGWVATEVWGGRLEDTEQALAVAPATVSASLLFGWAYYKILPAGSTLTRLWDRRRRPAAALAEAPR